MHDLTPVGELFTGDDSTTFADLGDTVRPSENLTPCCLAYR